MAKSPKWIIVSNRLPFTMTSSKKNLTKSTGGLVAALQGVRTDNQLLWLGCAPSGMRPSLWRSLQKTLKTKTKYLPLFLEEKLYDIYYNGFCNDVLWPLLHYETNYVRFSQQAWQAYKNVNEIFAQNILQEAKDGDFVWIHDFHLFLVPALLKKKNPRLKVGFFLHVPFPSSEVFRQLPVREEILNQVLASDLVGFHDYSYLRHFCSSLHSVLGIESSFLAVRRPKHTTRLGVFPVGIETSKFKKQSISKEVTELVSQIARPRFVFLGIDRLDYTKGIDLKLKAFRNLLERNPRLHKKVGLLQVAVPTRTDVPEYRRLKTEIDRLVGEINGAFGKPDWTPIQYIFSSVSFPQLMALYRLADAIIISSKRDGMNLVALEYIASQNERYPGVVLLSEFTGASSVLSHSVSINPWDLEGTAERMLQAIEMPNKEKNSRLSSMMNYIDHYTSTHWAASFIRQLDATPAAPTKALQIKPTLGETQKLVKKIPPQLRRRLTIIVDYDGTLVPIEQRPELAVLNTPTLRELKSLKRKGVQLVVVSGRNSQFLTKQLGTLEIPMAAEHGAKFYDPKKRKWQNLIQTPKSTWFPVAKKILADYAVRVPGSFVEEKEFALSWHYRNAPLEFSDYQAKKLTEELEMGLAKRPVNILPGKKVIEVRAMEANKGIFARRYLNEQKEPQFVLALGDDETDEDLFQAVRENGMAFKVGSSTTRAPYFLAEQEDVLPLLKNFNTNFEKVRKRATKG